MSIKMKRKVLRREMGYKKQNFIFCGALLSEKDKVLGTRLLRSTHTGMQNKTKSTPMPGEKKTKDKNKFGNSKHWKALTPRSIPKQVRRQLAKRIT